MKCPQCGADVAADAEFCSKCGAPLGHSAAPAAAASQPGNSPAGRLQPRGVADVPEVVLWEGGFSPKAMLGAWILGSFLGAILLLATIVLAANKSGLWMLPLALLVALAFSLAWHYVSRRVGIHYKLTNQRFFHERGVLKRVTNRIEVIDIDDIAFEQRYFDRLTGVGRIKIISSDRSDPELWLVGIDDVERVAGLIDKARRAERLRRGVSVDAV